LFRYDDHRFVALLTQTDASTADAVGRRVVSEVSKLRLIDEDGNASFGVRIGRATAPDDGSNLDEIIRAAENRAPLNPQTNRPSIH